MPSRIPLRSIRATDSQRRIGLDIDARGDWLLDVEHCPSPNWDERTTDGEIALVVVHGISLPPGEFGGPWIADLFLNRLDPEAHPYFREIAGLKVSAHAVIRRDGQIVQFVPFSKRAWHAGQSAYCGRNACNDFSIGIELEGTDDLPYTEAQYRSLAALIAALRVRYPAIAADAIVGHADIAPGRKTDPGPAFDWDKLAGLLPPAPDSLTG
ncbi:MAG: 1,6-anhydro-N-acetylmuramyl-L-alanine amidase AmpD [Gammaproteobacteria bacterium]|nr:1,6-anhydro-N-acetylmuramyl-L-alanine amidase AmpD [Gammaproteobacteria bacterium]